jgi:nicotinamidase-related amidase
VSTLIIVDMQRGFATDDKSRADAPSLAQRIADFVQDMDYERVIATKFINPEHSLFRRILDWHEMGPGDPDCELIDEIIPVADEVIDKGTYALPGYLVDQLRSPVHLCGMETDQCVLAAAAGLFDAGIEVAVIGDLCASTVGKTPHQSALAMLRRMIGDQMVIDSTDLRSNA